MFVRYTGAACLGVLFASCFRESRLILTMSVWQGLLWAIFWYFALASLIYGVASKRQWPKSAYPGVLCLATFILVWTLPFHRFSRYVEFSQNRAIRELIVEQILADTLHPPVLGHDITLIEQDGRKYIFFCTGQSSDDLEGWLYVPEGGDPALFEPHSRHHREYFDGHWYAVYY
jgi:hypothetical protein